MEKVKFIKVFMTSCIILLLPFCFVSCEKKSTKRYILKTTHDNNWTTSSSITCDSLTMLSPKEVILWIDGRKMRIFAPMFKIYDNPDYQE